MIEVVPGGRKNMLVHVKLGVPDGMALNLNEVAKVFPYGRLLPIEVVTGGLTYGCGRVVPELGDADDTAVVVCAAVSIGYHDPTDAASQETGGQNSASTQGRHRTWNTEDGF